MASNQHLSSDGNIRNVGFKKLTMDKIQKRYGGDYISVVMKIIFFYKRYQRITRVTHNLGKQRKEFRRWSFHVTGHEQYCQCDIKDTHDQSMSDQRKCDGASRFSCFK